MSTAGPPPPNGTMVAVARIDAAEQRLSAEDSADSCSRAL